MLLATLLLAGSFTFSHHEKTLLVGQETGIFKLEKGNLGDKLEIVAFKDGKPLGRFTVCDITQGSSCSANIVPGPNDVGLWAGPVLINGVIQGHFMVWVTASLSCEIPSWVVIQAARYPCWTLEQIKRQFQEAKVNVEFARWLRDLPFSEISLENEQAVPRLAVIEHPDVFPVSGQPAVGVFKAKDIHTIGWDVIEYSLKHEAYVLPMVLMHEFGHKLELEQERRWNPSGVLTSYVWWHFGHGDFLDPLVKSINHTKNWFFRGLPPDHGYWPGQVGHEPAQGTPGSISASVSPTLTSVFRYKQNEIEKERLFFDLKYHLDQHPEHRDAVCILRPN